MQWYSGLQCLKCSVAETNGHRIISQFSKTLAKGRVTHDMSKTTSKGRSAVTGRFVSTDYAQKHPSTTVVEKVKAGPVKHRG